MGIPNTATVPERLDWKSSLPKILPRQPSGGARSSGPRTFHSHATPSRRRLVRASGWNSAPRGVWSARMWKVKKRNQLSLSARHSPRSACHHAPLSAPHAPCSALRSLLSSLLFFPAFFRPDHDEVFKMKILEYLEVRLKLEVECACCRCWPRQLVDLVDVAGRRSVHRVSSVCIGIYGLLAS